MFKNDISTVVKAFCLSVFVSGLRVTWVNSLHVSGWPTGHPKIEEGEGLVENYQGGVILTALLRKPVRYNPFKCSVTEMETQHGMLELKQQK